MKNEKTIEGAFEGYFSELIFDNVTFANNNASQGAGVTLIIQFVFLKSSYDFFNELIKRKIYYFFLVNILI